MLRMHRFEVPVAGIFAIVDVVNNIPKNNIQRCRLAGIDRKFCGGYRLISLTRNLEEVSAGSKLGGLKKAPAITPGDQYYFILLHFLENLYDRIAQRAAGHAFDVSGKTATALGVGRNAGRRRSVQNTARILEKYFILQYLSA